jgi:hypothetical protein
MVGEEQGDSPRMRRSRSAARACHYADEIAVHSARKSVIFLCIMLRVGHSMVLVSPTLSDYYCHRWKGVSSMRVKVFYKVEQKHQSSRIGTASPRFNRALNSASKVVSDAYSEDDFGGELDEDGYSSSETKVSVDEGDDVSADEYFRRFISEALKEEEMNKNPETKKALCSPNSKDASSPDDRDVKRMMLQQQQQIDLLMKLIKEGRQQLPPQSDYPPINDKLDTKETFSPFTSATATEQKSKNVAPLKAMLFIDGTWLYYSLNTRNPKRDVIIGKFGLGWQNNFKVDW